MWFYVFNAMNDTASLAMGYASLLAMGYTSSLAYYALSGLGDDVSDGLPHL